MNAPLKRGMPPMHPGEFLKTITLPALAEAGTSRTEVARLLGIGRQTLYDLVDARRPVTPEMALRLARLLGNTPEHWLAMQAAYDLAKARVALGPQLEAIPKVKAA